MRIPFDSLTLRAVAHELGALEGARVQRIVQPDEWTVLVELYAGRDSTLLLSCHPVFARAHLVAKRKGGVGNPPAFCEALRARLASARLTSVRQVGFDRILELRFEGPAGEARLIAELMGKHANLILVDARNHIVSAAKWVNPSKSVRPITPGRLYEPPPFPPKPSLLTARDGDDLASFEGASPFLLKLIEQQGLDVLRRPFSPVYSPGSGAYPVSVAPLGLNEQPMPSIGAALEKHFAQAERQAAIDQLRQSLVAQLRRVQLARETALSDLRQAADAAAQARSQQMKAELILAYGGSLPPGAKVLEAVDYEGNPVSIKLNADLDFKQNAERLFDKARRAKRGADLVRGQIERMERDWVDVTAHLHKVETEETLEGLRDLADQAQRRRWTHQQVHSETPEKRPYEGHRVRELIGPGGVTVLYGETAEANDYLTLRVAKPDDWWLHVRGSTSAHVVIVTNKRPEKIGREALEFAAKVAVQHSASKHSGFVPVDYTLKKYVRRPRGAKVGTVFYTHEKTLHVEGK